MTAGLVATAISGVATGIVRSCSPTSSPHHFGQDEQDPPEADRIRRVLILSAKPILPILTRAVTERSRSSSAAVPSSAEIVIIDRFMVALPR
jgi:hypothetical protein